MASQGYKHAGDIEVESAILVLSGGDTIDIANLVTEVNIYENLFNHYLEAEFVMDDSVNLFATGSSGTEVVEISFRNMVGSEVDVSSKVPFVRHVFSVYEISDKQRISEFREIYVMNCVSFEKYLTTPTKISRSYGPSKISEMVSKINNEFVYNTQAKDFYRQAGDTFSFVKDKTGTIDETQGQHQLIIPNMPVDDAINFLCKEADSKDHIPYYTFYEDADGFNFRNISELTSQPIFKTYHHLPTATDEPGNRTNVDVDINFDDTYKILSFNVIKQSNILQNTNQGLFRTRTINLDLHRRTTKTVIYDYDNYSDKFKAIENKILGGSLGNPIVTLETTRDGHDVDETLKNELHLPKRINVRRAISKGYERSLFNVVMEISVPGNDELRVGQILELMFYSTDNNEVSLDKFDKYLSGKYLVTKVRQKINGAKTGSEYVTILECTRDGIREN